MDGDRNYFLGGDKTSADMEVQGTITPTEDTNAYGKIRLNFNLYFTSSRKHVREMYTPHTPLLYSKTWVYGGILSFLLCDPKHRLWVLVRTASARLFLEPPQQGCSNMYPRSMF